MRKMHETDGSKTCYQSSYQHHNSYHHHYNNHQHNNHRHHHHSNNNNNNSFGNGGGSGGGGNGNFQHHHHHSNNNNGGAGYQQHPNGYHNNYRNNCYGNRRIYNKRNNNYNHHNNHHHNHQYNNHPPRPQIRFPLPHHHHQPDAIGPLGQMADHTVLQIPVVPSSVMDQNNGGPQFAPPVPPSTPCGPDSSASSVKSETNSACSSEHEELPPQQQQPTVPMLQQSRPKSISSTTVNVVPPPAPSNFPDYETVCKELVALSDCIWKKFLGNQQSPEIFKKKMELWRDLNDLFKTTHAMNYPRYHLQVVGSTMSGFGSRASDVDVCLMIRRCEVDQRIEAVDRLHELQASLQKIPYMENIELIYAKVPILKFRDRSRNLDVDLNCNNSVGIRNTHLLYCYSQLDLRVKPLVLVVKLWAQFHGINDAKNMTISSYSLVLMVIHYLQFGCKEPVLPCLHQMYPDKFSPYLDVEKIRINEQIPKWDSHNSESLGELLIGFLEYYARKFDYARAAVSVRLGCHVPIKLCMQTRSYKNDPHQWKYLCVEEPFDLTNTARSVYDKEAFDRIRGVFYASWQRLMFTRDLESIFHLIPDNESRAIASRLAPTVLR